MVFIITITIRKRSDLHQPKVKLNLAKRTFRYSGSAVFNLLQARDFYEVIVDEAEGRINYLNNRVFLSRNYRLIVAPRKLFDVLKTDICPRSEASRANMLVLRTSTA